MVNERRSDTKMIQLSERGAESRFNLKAKRQHESEDTLEKRLAIAQQLKVRCFVSKIDGDGPVFTGLAGCVSHGHPQVTWSMQWITKDEDKASQFQEDRGGETLPLKSVECDNSLQG